MSYRCLDYAMYSDLFTLRSKYFMLVLRALLVFNYKDIYVMKT